MSIATDVVSAARSMVLRLRTCGVCLPVILNLALLALYAWAASETTVVEVSVQGDRLLGRVNGYELVLEDGGTGGERTGLYMGGAWERRTYEGIGPAQDSSPGWLRELAARLREGPLDPAWQHVTVSDGEGRAVYDWPSGPTTTAGWGEADRTARLILLDGPAQGIGGAGGEGYTVRASLRAGVTPAGVLVRAQDTANGMLLLVRPEYRDLQWWRLSNGQWEGPLAAGFWSKTAWSLLQDDLRLLLVTQQLALALVVLLLMLSWVAVGVGRMLGVKPPSYRLGAVVGQAAEHLVPPARPFASLRVTIQKLLRSSIRHLKPGGLAILLALAAAGVAAYVAVYLLEGMPHVQDDVTYLFQARVMALGRLWVPASPIPEAFEQEFIVNYAGRAFGKYPPGHSVALLPGVLAGAPWLVNPLQAGLAVLVTYLIGREVYGRGIGLLAALLMATSPFFVFMSGSLMAHPTGLLFILLFALLFVKSAQGRSRMALLGGLALGFAFLTRPYTAAAIAAPFGLYAGYRVARSRGRELRRYAPFVVGMAPMVLALLAYNYALTGNALQNPMELWWRFDKIGFGPGVGMSGGHTVTDGLWNTYRNLTELMKHLYGWPAYLTLTLALVPFVTLQAGRWDWLFLAGWLALVVAHIAWWADGIMYGPRYYYETLGLVALLTAQGVGVLQRLTVELRAPNFLAPLRSCEDRLEAHLHRRWCPVRGMQSSAQGRLLPAREGGRDTAYRTPTERAREVASTSTTTAAAVSGWPRGCGSIAGPVAVLFVLGLIGYNLAYYLPVQWTLHKGYNYVNGDALRAVSAGQIHDAVVFVDLGKWYEWWNYGAVFPANRPTLDGDVVYARDRGTAENRRVMEIYPGRRYYRLSGTSVEEIEAE